MGEVQHRMSISKEILAELEREYKTKITEEPVILVWGSDGDVWILPNTQDLYNLKFISRKRLDISKSGSARLIIPKNVSSDPKGLVPYLENGVIKIRRGL